MEQVSKNSMRNLKVSFGMVGFIFGIDHNFTDSNTLRPAWDKYFLRLAEVVASRSNCMKRAVGAVIV